MKKKWISPDIINLNNRRIASGANSMGSPECLEFYTVVIGSGGPCTFTVQFVNSASGQVCSRITNLNGIVEFGNNSVYCLPSRYTGTNLPQSPVLGGVLTLNCSTFNDNGTTTVTLSGMCS